MAAPIDYGLLPTPLDGLTEKEMWLQSPYALAQEVIALRTRCTTLIERLNGQQPKEQNHG